MTLQDDEVAEIWTCAWKNNLPNPKHLQITWDSGAVWTLTLLSNEHHCF